MVTRASGLPPPCRGDKRAASAASRHQIVERGRSARYRTASTHLPSPPPSVHLRVTACSAFMAFSTFAHLLDHIHPRPFVQGSSTYAPAVGTQQTVVVSRQGALRMAGLMAPRWFRHLPDLPRSIQFPSCTALQETTYRTLLVLSSDIARFFERPSYWLKDCGTDPTHGLGATPSSWSEHRRQPGLCLAGPRPLACLRLSECRPQRYGRHALSPPVSIPTSLCDSQVACTALQERPYVT